MENAKEELKSTLEYHMLEYTDIVAAEITYEPGYFAAPNRKEQKRVVRLSNKHTTFDITNFFAELDFIYDSGFGGQELFGTIWLTNGRWLEREEYDGSEWWKLREFPPIPKYLTQ